MAFNPFRAFRKHKRALFAALTIMCMFIFVFTTGASSDNAFFASISRWLGLGSKGRATKVATVNGKKVTEQDLLDLVDRRRIANEILYRNTMNGIQQVADDLLQPTAGQDPQTYRLVQQIANPLSSQYDFPFYSPPLRLFMAASPGFQQNNPGYEFQLRMVQFQRKHLPLMDPKAKTDSLEDLEKLMVKAIQLGTADPEQLYFGDSTRPDDLLMFLVWKHEADKRNIQLTTADVVKLANFEAMNRGGLKEDPKEDPLVQSALKRRKEGKEAKLTPAQVYQAIADEFRVAIAKRQVLGANDLDLRVPADYEGGYRQPVAPVAPPEFYQYYRDNLASLNVTVLPIPVKDFKTGEQPSDDEIKRLYNRYRNVEPAPDRAEPGFKVPRQVKVEWVGVDFNSPEYRKHYEKTGPEAEDIALKFGSGTIGLGHLFIGGDYPAWLAQTVTPLWPDLRLVMEYDAYRKAQEKWAREVEGWHRVPAPIAQEEQFAALNQALAAGDLGTGGPLFATIPLTALRAAIDREASRQVQDGVLPAVLGELTGALASGGSPVTALSAYEGAEMLRARQRGAAALAAGWALSPTLAPDASLVLAQAVLTDVRPPADVKATLAASLLEKQAREKAAGEITSLRLAMQTHFAPDKPKPDRKKPGVPDEEARKWLADELDQRPFLKVSLRQLDQLRHRLNIGQDEKIQPLKQAFQRDNSNKEDPEGLEFAGQFIPAPMRGRPEGRAPLYIPQQLPWSPDNAKSKDEMFLFWVSEQKDPYTPGLDEARDQVIAAWQFQKRRELAEREAKRLADEVRGKIGNPAEGDSGRPLAVEGKKHGWEAFQVDGVQKLSWTNYEPYSVDKKRFRYPDPKFAEKLVDALKKPGDVTILADVPQKNFYVFQLNRREDPTVKGFVSLLKGTPSLDKLWAHMEKERREERRKEAIQQMKIEAGLLDEDGKPKYEVSEELRNALAGNRRGDPDS